MNKRIVISVITASLLTLGLSGCGVSLNTNSPSVKSVKEFKNGRVTKTTRILISERELALLSSENSAPTTLEEEEDTKDLSTAFNNLVNSVISKEVKAFKTVINGNDIAYLRERLPLNTKVEYLDDGKNILSVKVLIENIENVAVKNETVVDAIDKRFSKNGLWNYHLQEKDITLSSKDKHYFLNDLVSVTFDKNQNIISIKKLKSAVVKKVKKVVVIKKPIEAKKVKKVVVIKKPIEAKETVKIANSKASKADTKKDIFWE